MSKIMMDEITYLAAHGSNEEVNKKLGRMVEVDRRVVSRGIPVEAVDTTGACLPTAF